MKKNTIICVSFIAMVLFAACNKKDSSAAKAAEGNHSFGDSVPLANGLQGKVFLLSSNTVALPDFDTMKPLPTYLYTSEVNIPTQDWSAGFPGLPNRFEWFGIEYSCNFKTVSQGNYTFRLLSDDGSKLWIDDKLIIDNDGMHSSVSKTGTVFLNDSAHTAKLDYFQGPRYQLALQLFWSLGGVKEQIFPGKNFILYTPKPASRWMWWLLAIAVLISLIVYFISKKKRAKTKPDKGFDKDERIVTNGNGHVTSKTRSR